MKILDETFLNEKKAAELLGVAVETLRCQRARRQNTPPCIKLGRRIVYREKDLLDWILQQRQ